MDRCLVARENAPEAGNRPREREWILPSTLHQSDDRGRTTSEAGSAVLERRSHGPHRPPHWPFEPLDGDAFLR